MFVKNGSEMCPGMLVSLVNTRTGYLYDVQKGSTFWVSRDTKLNGVIIAMMNVGELMCDMQFFIDMKARDETAAIIQVFEATLHWRGQKMYNEALLRGVKANWLPGMYIAVDNAESVDVMGD